VVRLFVLLATLLISLKLDAQDKQDKRDVLIAVRRAGAIEFIDPKTLSPISQLQIDVPPNSTGLNGILVSTDGSTLYVEGPTAPNEKGESGCCYLYSIDLTTLHAKLVAGIWGSSSRGSLLVADRTVYPLSVVPAKVTDPQLIGHEWHISPNGHWLLGIEHQQHVVTVYDLSGGSNARHFEIPGVNDEWWVTGTWLGDKFYLYAKQGDNTERLWTISPGTAQLTEGIALSSSNATADCSKFYITEIVAAGEQLFVAEIFGGKIDRRVGCNKPITGGASIIDPRSGQLLGQITPELYFWSLIPNESGSELYGLTAEDVDRSSQNPVELVRIDTHTGRVLQSRLLEGSYWWITTAKVLAIPASHQHIALRSQ